MLVKAHFCSHINQFQVKTVIITIQKYIAIMVHWLGKEKNNLSYQKMYNQGSYQ